MRRFVFGMEKLLGLRAYEEQRARNSLTAVNARCESIEDQIVHLQQERMAFLSHFQTGMVDVGGYLAASRYRDALLGRISGLRDQLAAARKEREQAIENYRYHRRRYSALQLVRERRFGSWRRDYIRSEGKQLDDITHAQRGTGIRI